MLQREVMMVVRQRVPVLGFVLVFLALALWFGARQPAYPAPDIVFTSPPAPGFGFHVEQEPPPPALLPPPPLATVSVPPHPCGTDLDRVGDPSHEPIIHMGEPIPPHTILAYRVGAAVDGCTIAVWSEYGVLYSFDGGQRFHQLYVSTISAIAVAADRIAIVRDRAKIGVVTPAAPTAANLTLQPEDITWHPLGDAAPPAVHNPDQDRGANVRLWLGPDRLIVVDPETDYANRLAVSFDDGETFASIETPSAHYPRVTFTEDRIHLAGFGISDPYVDGEIPTPGRWSARLADLTWEPAALPADRWTYSIEADEHWGCGGTSKVMARKGRRDVTLIGGLGETTPTKLVTSPAASYVLVADRLHRIDGARAVDLGVPPTAEPRTEHFPYTGFELAGVDATGAPLAFIGDTLARRTRAGTWRALAR